ncbi:MAG: helix-turn-helix domain-containing protein [Alphaproteobacteria bacterium]|nr:helix-turn-helix domain-containing protein [Alphaproteobacteria bacterium]
MALFFDAAWFDAKLQAQGTTREALAAHLGIAPSALAELWKDQRELKSHEVLAIARFLGATPQEVADHAGVSTPVPKVPTSEGEMAAKLEEINGRLIKLEQMMVEVKALLLERKR